LAALPEERRRTLVAVEHGRRLRFDVRLQGSDETVFLRYPAHDE
jgi:protocatechuate 3,4-dioxygenase alpha subunit